MWKFRIIGLFCVWSAGVVHADGHGLPQYVLPPGIMPEQVIGVSPSFEAQTQDILNGYGPDILRDAYPDFEPLPDSKDGGIWFGNPDGIPGAKDYGQISLIWVEINGETVCIQVSSQERLDNFFPVIPQE